ncbi:MAG: hypothetical protein QOI95_3184 [Acidimicrobiaceae bacterium]|jgi:uncharacterized protein (TIGR03086 family)
MRPLPEVHRDALAATGVIVAGIKADQLDAPTPCEDYDVRGLLQHVISGNYWVAPLVEGKTIAEVGDALDRPFSVEDYDTSAEQANAAFSAPGAMQKPVAVSYGPVPAEVYAGHRFIDVLVHGWDLAKATGQDTTLDPGLVDACFEVIAPQIDLLKGSGMFGTEVDVPADADPQTKLLATLGRHA